MHFIKNKLITILGAILLSIGTVSAYTPSADLESKLERASDRINEIITSKGNSYRTDFISILESYKTRYASDERASYILTYLSDNLIGFQLNDVAPLAPIIVSQAGDYTGSYTIDDSTYGTKVDVLVQGATRTITSNALANHKVGEFPRAGNPNTITAQNKTWTFTTSPNYTGNQTWMKESGVAYNGVKFELETAEKVTCTSGEIYKIEAQQSMFNLGLDDNLAHVQPTGEYHYHGVSQLLMDSLEGDNLVHVGYANDGFPLYYSKQGSYTPSYALKKETRQGTTCSYAARETIDVVIDGTTPDGTFDLDWEYQEGLGNLDACNGATVNGEYVYFITEKFPHGPRCSNGEVSAQGGKQGAGAPRSQNGNRRGPAPR